MKRLSRAQMWKGGMLIACAVFSIVHAANGTAPNTESDEAAIRSIIQEQVAAWNQGDATAYSRHFATDGTFTNIRGQFFKGYDGFLKQHEVIFQTIFKKTT